MSKLDRNTINERLFGEGHALVSLLGKASSAISNEEQGNQLVPYKNDYSTALDFLALLFHRGGIAPYSAVGFCPTQDNSILVISYGEAVKNKDREIMSNIANILIKKLKQIYSSDGDSNSIILGIVHQMKLELMPFDGYLLNAKLPMPNLKDFYQRIKPVHNIESKSPSNEESILPFLDWYNKKIYNNGVESILNNISTIHVLNEAYTGKTHVEQNVVGFLRDSYQGATEIAVGLSHEKLIEGKKIYNPDFTPGCCAICSIEFEVLEETGIKVYRSTDYKMNFPPKLNGISKNMDNDERLNKFIEIVLDRIKIKYKELQTHTSSEIKDLEQLLNKHIIKEPHPFTTQDDMYNEVFVEGDDVIFSTSGYWVEPT